MAGGEAEDFCPLVVLNDDNPTLLHFNSTSITLRTAQIWKRGLKSPERRFKDEHTNLNATVTTNSNHMSATSPHLGLDSNLDLKRLWGGPLSTTTMAAELSHRLRSAFGIGNRGSALNSRDYPGHLLVIFLVLRRRVKSNSVSETHLSWRRPERVEIASAAEKERGLRPTIKSSQSSRRTFNSANQFSPCGLNGDMDLRKFNINRGESLLNKKFCETLARARARPGTAVHGFLLTDPIIPTHRWSSPLSQSALPTNGQYTTREQERFISIGSDVKGKTYSSLKAHAHRGDFGLKRQRCHHAHRAVRRPRAVRATPRRPTPEDSPTPREDDAPEEGTTPPGRIPEDSPPAHGTAPEDDNPHPKTVPQVEPHRWAVAATLGDGGR
ncbi:hypothetical protein BDZ89DRAFT_1225573 [Hymenopellis radicata]|nr:hypothetical protein BDZ89DRAFT_1225573 [Hymenopellis radicata]